MNLTLPITHIWNGNECADTRLHATMKIECVEDGIRLTATSTTRDDHKIPSAPIGWFDGLWDYDVVECFLVGESGHYIEVELGAGGHWLVLSFDGVRHRSDSHEDLPLNVQFQKNSEEWRSSVVIPSSILPEPIVAANAFVIARGQFLAAYKLPGEVEDFHQPAEYPRFS